MSIIVAKFPGFCRACGVKIPAGTKVSHTPGEGITHTRCADGARDDRHELDLDALEAPIEDPFAAAVAASRAVDADPELTLDVPDGRALKDYQRAGVAYMLARSGTILADEMGLGKTIQAIVYINTHRDITSALVITPKSLTINWQREWDRWSTTNERALRCGDPGWENARWLIISFEQAKKYRDLLEARAWGVAIIDEAHRIKNQKKRLSPEQAEAELAKQRAAGSRRKTLPKRGAVQRTEAVHACIQHTRRRIAITGTPFENRPKELFPLLVLVCPEVWKPGDFMAFARRYCDAKRVPIWKKGVGGGKPWQDMVWKFDGASNMPELQERIRATCVLRRLKRDVLKELPPKIRRIIELDPDKKSDKMVQLELAHAGPRVDGRGIRWQQEEDYFDKLRELLADAERPGFHELAHVRAELAVVKAPAVAEYVEGLLDGGATKVLVGAWHHGMMGALEELLAKRGVVRVTGKESVEERQANVDRFQEDAGIRVAIGQIDACGVGYNMTAASDVVLGELPWKPSQCSQFEDRAHRMGQSLPVNVHHLVYRGSLDARMAALMVDKQRIADAALDQPS